MRRFALWARHLWLLALLPLRVFAQESFPVNDVADPRTGTYAFTNATIVKDAATTLTNATLLIKNGKIVAVGSAVKIPADAVVLDCSGKYIYPSFIDLYADYGVPTPTRQQGAFNFNAPAQLVSNQKDPLAGTRPSALM